MNNVTIDKIFEQFTELLEDRFSKQVYTTEDSIRYSLFYCLTNYGRIHPSDVILEYPHPHFSGAKVDTYIPPQNGHFGLVFEFKFDREIPSSKNPPKTQKAGKVFADIFLLVLFKPDNKNVRSYFVYVTDKEMATYFQNPSNQLDNFFNLMPGDILKIDRKYIEKHPRIFVKSVGSNIVDCEVLCYLRKEFPSEIWVRIYEIKPTNIR
uniref:Restriction endonuclease n=1 Tax=candidate division CPR3 bacterium TaxID=2268181 RepID=A0A7C5Z2W5_UNCC3